MSESQIASTQPAAYDKELQPVLAALREAKIARPEELPIQELLRVAVNNLGEGQLAAVATLIRAVGIAPPGPLESILHTHLLLKTTALHNNPSLDSEEARET